MVEQNYTTVGMHLWVLIALFSHAASVEALWLRQMLKLNTDVGTVVKFRLINADTDLPIMDITNNQIVVLPLLNATNFNIDAVTVGHVGSIRFGYQGNQKYRVESRSPFALCGDDWLTGNYKACPNFAAGRHDITATPYYRVFEAGQKGKPVTLSFTVVTTRPSTAAPVKPSAPVRIPIRAPQRTPTRPVPATKAPSANPVRPPTKVKPPTRAPLRIPTIATPSAKTPIKIPTIVAPTKPISPTPRTPPFTAPQRVPTKPIPIAKAPTKSPIRLPVNAPTMKACTIPKFIESSWQISGPLYPLPRFAEPQGLIIGNDMVIFSGFVNYFANATNQTYARDVTDSSSMWRRMDDMPMASGVTHAATVAIGTKVYLCGGYIGGHPGPHVPYCFVYDHSVSPGRQKQWTRFANLPNGGSAGGGMIYDSALNALFFSGGGQRREVGNPHPVDINNTWKFQLKNPSLGWVASTPIPYVANHLSYVTHMDGRGVERHFFLGGQVGEYECCTNFALNYEFIARTETWIRRASMPIPRGHATSSTRAIGCGFITAGGAINSANTTKVRTDDISYYDVPTDTWTVGIGTLPRATVTPIVDIHSNGYMYFVTGLPNQSRRQISVA